MKQACANCRNKFEKKTYHQKFCRIKCKDRFHNRVNPRGKFAHLNPNNYTDDEWYERSIHPFSEEAFEVTLVGGTPAEL